MVEKKSYVFISYSRSDKSFVNRLMADLEAAGVSVWIDKEGLKPGMPNFDQALRDALRSAYALLLVASPHSRRSNYVQGELEIAEMYDCPVYPVWGGGDEWADCVPLHMIKMQYVDARGDSYSTGLAAVLETLHSIAPDSAPSVPDKSLPIVEADFEPRNPYKGLRAFREDDQADFFGRQKLVEGLLDALRNQPDSARLLAIVGPSGSGKSSIIMAGLLPRLRAGQLPGSENWIYLDPTVPGTHPLRSLSIPLANALPERSHRAINEDLSDPEGLGLHLLAGQITRQAGKKLVIFIDQFEELFTQTVSDDERKQFINLLVSAVTEPRGSVIVMLTLRADFYDRPMASAPALAELLKAHHPILPMTIDDLRAVIEAPARLPDVKLTFDDGLVGDLLFETRDQAGGLPLLQFTLDQLFQNREGHRLTSAAYQAIGGLRGALAKHAESTYAALPSEEHRTLLRALFLRLIEPGATEQDTTRRRAPMSELEGVDAARTDKMRDAAARFVEARLLTADKDTIEVSHEALIREWPRLGEWLHEGREDIRLQKEISSDAAEWARRGQPIDRLYQGSVLEDARSWAQRNIPSQIEMNFIEASAAYAEQLQTAEKARLIREETQARELEVRGQSARRLRIFLSAMAAALLVVLGLGAFALTESNRASAEADAASTARYDAELLATDADRARATSERNAAYSESLRLAAAASNALTNRDLQLVALLGIRSLQAGYSAEADAALGQALTFEFPLSVLSGHTDSVYAVAFSPDGRHLLSSSYDATVRLWDVPTGTEVWRFELETTDEGTGMAFALRFSPNGQLVAIGGRGGTALLLDVRTGHAIRLIINGSVIDALVFSPDGRYLAVGSQNSATRLWDTQTGALIRHYDWYNQCNPACPDTEPPNYTVNSLAFSSDSQQLLTGGGDGSARLWNVTSGQPLRTFEHGDQGRLTIAFHPDGQHVLTAGLYGDVYLWELTSGKEIRSYSSAGGGITGLQFAPDGNTFVAVSSDNNFFSLMDTSTAALLRLFRIPRVFGSNAQNSTVTVMEAAADCVNCGSIPQLAALSPDGRLLASPSDDGSIRLWDTLAQADGHRFAGEVDGLTDVIYHPSGGLLARGFDDSLRMWETASGSEIRRIQLREEPVITAAPAPSPVQSVLAPAPVSVEIAPESADTTSADVTVDEPLTQSSTPVPPSPLTTNAVLSADGRYVLVGAGNVIERWDLQLGRLDRTFTINSPNTNFEFARIALRPDGEVLAAAARDSSFWLINLTTGEQRRLLSLSNHPNAYLLVIDMLYSSDGKYLLAGGADFGALMWDTTDGSLVRQFGEPGRTVVAVAVSPNGRYAVTSEFVSGYVARLWDVSTGESIRQFLGHSQAIYDIAFSPDGSTLLTGSEDFTARLWNVESGAELRRFGSYVAVRSVAFSPDGQEVAIGGLGPRGNFAPLRVWSIHYEDLLEYACQQVHRDLTEGEMASYALTARATCPNASSQIEVQPLSTSTMPAYTPLPTATPSETLTPSPTFTPTATQTPVYLQVSNLEATRNAANIMTATAGGETLLPLPVTKSPSTATPVPTWTATATPTIPPEIGPTWTAYPAATLAVRTPLPTATPSPTVDLTRTTATPTPTPTVDGPKMDDIGAIG